VAGRSSSLERFSKTIECIYIAASAPASWPSALSSIASLFDAEGAAIYFYSGNVPSRFICSEGIQHAVEVYNAEGWWKRDLHAQRACTLNLTSGDVFDDHMVASPSEIDAHPIYSDFFRRVGFGRLMCCSILPDIDKLVAVSVPRARIKGSYDAQEMEMLGALGRHVEQAMRLSLRIAGLEGLDDALQKAQELEGAAVFVLGADGDLVHASGMAEELLSRYFSVIDGRITPVCSIEQARFQSMVDNALKSVGDWGAVPKSCLVTGVDKSRVALRAIPITPASRQHIGFGDGARALLLASPVTSRRHIDPALIRDVFDLSLGEARLSGLIGGGYTIQDAAAQLGIAEGTARIVLKNVFRKLGINRQAELILLLSSLAGASKESGSPSPRQFGRNDRTFQRFM
jgi:DNA-binding CsgD family transcriptional regulator